jgi:hypothetical protein
MALLEAVISEQVFQAGRQKEVWRTYQEVDRHASRLLECIRGPYLWYNPLMPTRRETAQHLCTALIASGGLAGPAFGASASKQRFLLVGLCGSENPTRANFPFAWAAALHEGGHEVRIELAGDATVLMRSTVAANVTPVGWPPLSQAISKVIEHQVPIFV